MVRRRWPDVVIVLGIVAVTATGVWALWGDVLGSWWRPGAKPAVEEAPPAAGAT